MMPCAAASALPLPAPVALRRVWVSWAEAFAGPHTLAPRGEYRAFLVFAPARDAADAVHGATHSLELLGWRHVAALAGPVLDPERLHQLPEEFHALCEAALAGETAIMHYPVTAAASLRSYRRP